MALPTEMTRRWRLPDLPTATVTAAPSIDRATMLAANRIATDRIGLSLLQMMESAGRELAALTRLILGGSLSGGSSLDIPTGVDASTGERHGAAIAADATLALAVLKRGMALGEGARLPGSGYLADIGLPASIFAELGVDADGLFAAGPLLRLV